MFSAPAIPQDHSAHRAERLGKDRASQLVRQLCQQCNRDGALSPPHHSCQRERWERWLIWWFKRSKIKVLMGISFLGTCMLTGLKRSKINDEPWTLFLTQSLLPASIWTVAANLVPVIPKTSSRNARNMNSCPRSLQAKNACNVCDNC